MDWNIVEGNWKQFKGKVKEQWGKLTDDHLDVIAGKRDQLAGKIQESYGITKDEAEKQIEDSRAQQGRTTPVFRRRCAMHRVRSPGCSARHRFTILPPERSPQRRAGPGA